jgi:hypothetical protein
VGRSLLEQAPGIVATGKLNALNIHLREDLSWNSVHLSKAVVHSWHPKNARASEVPDYVRPRRTGSPEQGTIF